MKKTLLVPALLASTLAMASDYKYEISPMIGLNLAEGNLGIKNDISNGGYPIFGLELQANTPDSRLSPEISLFYTEGVDYVTGQETKIGRGMFNAVYTFDKEGSITPFVKAGAGYEKLSVETSSNEDGFFLDAGAGLKIALMDQLALKLEAIYMAKPGTNNSGFADSNLMTMVGLSYSFGETAQKAAPVKEEKKEEPVAAPVVVDGDDDKDGVLNSKDKCPDTPAGAKVDANGCELDDDNDGVVNSKDKCPNTPAGAKVDANGCELDDDKDGVVNSKDLCSNTPAGAPVNESGCPDKFTLKLNFEYDSVKITQDSDKEVTKFATFLKAYTNYKAEIVGHTDSRGSAKYNEKLSLERAQSVVDTLVSKGVEKDQLIAVGKGEAEPIASNMLEEGRAKNRRIEARLTRIK